MFNTGDRVQTPNGIGTVVFKRMAPPDYASVSVYGVHLDVRAAQVESEGGTYKSTVFRASDVWPLDGNP